MKNIAVLLALSLVAGSAVAANPNAADTQTQHPDAMRDPEQEGNRINQMSQEFQAEKEDVKDDVIESFMGGPKDSSSPMAAPKPPQQSLPQGEKSADDQPFKIDPSVQEQNQDPKHERDPE